MKKVTWFHRNELYVELLRRNATFPLKQKESPGWELYPSFTDDAIFIFPGETITIPAGFSYRIHPSKYLEIKELSNLESEGLHLSSGIYDSNYTDELMIAFTNTSRKIIVISNVSSNLVIVDTILHSPELIKKFCDVYNEKNLISTEQFQDSVKAEFSNKIWNSIYIKSYTKPIAQMLMHDVKRTKVRLFDCMDWM